MFSEITIWTLTHLIFFEIDIFYLSIYLFWLNVLCCFWIPFIKYILVTSD